MEDLTYSCDTFHDFYIKGREGCCRHRVAQRVEKLDGRFCCKACGGQLWHGALMLKEFHSVPNSFARCFVDVDGPAPVVVRC